MFDANAFADVNRPVDRLRLFRLHWTCRWRFASSSPRR
jgi:hypothetical protein